MFYLSSDVCVNCKGLVSVRPFECLVVFVLNVVVSFGIFSSAGQISTYVQ